MFPYLWLGLSKILHHFWMGITTFALVLGRMWSYIRRVPMLVFAGLSRAMSFTARILWTGCAIVPDVVRMVARGIEHRKGVFAISEFNLTRERLLSLIATLWVFGIVGFAIMSMLMPPPPEPTVEVDHWTNGHLLRDGLLPDMAIKFNEAGHKAP